MKKILLLCLMILLCAGCQAQYNITINEDLTVNETLQATEGSDFFARYPKSSTGRVVGFILEPHLDTLNENNYIVDNIVTTNKGGAIVKKKFKSLEEYKDSSILTSQFTKNLTYSKNGSAVTLSAKGKFSKEEQNQDVIAIDTGSISITVPFKVTNHNADEVVDNVYTWNFGENDIDEREIKMTFDSSKINKKINYVPFIIVGVIGVLLICIFFVYNKVVAQRASINEI